MRYPKFIKKGDTIAFPAPSFGASIEPYGSLLKNAVKKLEEMGYKTDLGPNAFLGEGVGISNTPEKCAEELADYYESHGDMLISVGGGELMIDTLAALDLDRIAAAEPKWFMGYSDNTHFGFPLATIFDTASLYGPNSSDFGMENWHESIYDAEALISGKSAISHGYDAWESVQLKCPENPLAGYNTTEKTELGFFGWDGRAITGRFAGGCLDVLAGFCGTRFDNVAAFNEKYRGDGIIWFLEACDLMPIDIRRALWQLREAGWFKYAKAFIFGRPRCKGCGADWMGIDEHNAVTSVLSGMGVPIITDADIGHLPPMMTMINGGFGTLSKYKENNIKIEWEFK